MDNCDNIKYKLLKIWVGLTCIVTLIYLAYWYFNYEFYPIAYLDKKRLKFLRENTPAHPPPLISFIDHD